MEPPRVEPAPPPASPFNPQPRPARGGCPKPLIFGCLGLLLLVGLGLFGFFFYVSTHFGKLLQFSLRQTETAVFAALPKDATPEEQQQLRQAFAAADQRAGRVQGAQEMAESGQELQFTLLHNLRKAQDHTLTRADLPPLTSALEQFARTGTAPGTR
jgi:hypothetical protein